MDEREKPGEQGEFGELDGLVAEELSDDAIAGPWRVFQRVRGHRYSLDDVATAWEAARERPDASSVADLGCGIGSVAIMLAYKLPTARIVGVEVQAISIALARRNVARNGLDDRIVLHHGDLRDPDLPARLGAPFDLVTGTPPYFDPAKSSRPPDPQRAFARLELHGGIEDYLRAAARLVAPGGRVVICSDARRPVRVLAGAAAAGLVPIGRRDVIPREGKPALFTIWTLAPNAEGTRSERWEQRTALIARDRRGARTEAALALRRFFGLPVREDEPPSPPLRPRRGTTR